MIGNVNKQCWVSIRGNKIHFQKTNKKVVYSQLINCKSTTSKANSNYSRQFDISEAEWKIIYLLPSQLSVSNKARELQYKILHNYVASNKLWYNMNITAAHDEIFVTYIHRTHNTCLITVNKYKIYGFKLKNG